MQWLETKSIFRGGGIICSTQVPNQDDFQHESTIDLDMIRDFFLQFDGLCNKINQNSKSIQSQQSQNNIITAINAIHVQSQYINQASRSQLQKRVYIKQALNNLESLLESINDILLTQRYIALQILKICNQISRLIFQYYAGDQSIPLNVDQQQSLINQINQIEVLLKQDGEQLFSNSLTYELFVVKICIEICPTNSSKGQDVVLNIIGGIQSSLEEFSPDLLISLAQGGLYSYKQYEQRKQRHIFQIIFYLEEFKWRLIEKIQQGLGLNKIVKQLAANYNILIKNSNAWLIKCSWIKLISDLITYKPLLTYNQFLIIKQKYQLQQDWDYLSQQKIIKIINKNIGLILKNDQSSTIKRLVQQQLIKFQQLQDYLINGFKNLPTLEELKGINNQQETTFQQQNNEIINQIQTLPIPQLIKQLVGYQSLLLNYIELILDYNEDIQNRNKNNQYLIGQIEQIQSQNDQLVFKWNEIQQNSLIIQNYLQNFTIQQGQNEQYYVIEMIVLNQLISYFSLANQLNFEFDDLRSEYQNQIKGLQILYNLEPVLSNRFIGLIDNVEQMNNLTLIQKLDNLKQSLKNSITIQDLYYLVNQIPKITQQILKDRQQFIQEQIHIHRIHSLLLLDQSRDKIGQAFKLDFEKYCYNSTFLLYSNISSLILCYQQISDNQAIFVNYLRREITDKFDYGVDISCLQINYRVDEIAHKFSSLTDMVSCIRSNQTQLDQKINAMNIFKLFLIDWDKCINHINSDIDDKLQIIDKNIQTQQQQNPLLQIKESILDTNNRISDLIDMDKLTFIGIVMTQLQSYSDLNQLFTDRNDEDLQNHIEFFKLIMQDESCQFQNIDKKDVIELMKQQNIKFLDLIEKELQKTNQNEDSHLTKIRTYFQNVQNYVNNLNFIKIIQSNKELHEIPNMINYLKILKYYEKEMDLYKKIQYDKITEILSQLLDFDYLFSIAQIEADIQNLTILDKQKQKISLEAIQKTIPSYNKLLEEVEQIANKQPITQKLIQSTQDLLSQDSWRIKDYLYFNCLSIHQCLSKSNQEMVSQFIIMARFKETDHRVINTLTGKNQIQQMITIINNQWEQTKDKIDNELQLTLNELQAIQLSIQSEERKEIRDSLLQKHKNLEIQLEQQMKNVEDIGDVLGITIYFLQDIKKDLVNIQQKLDNIMSSIDQIGQDIKFLRGKTPQQLLEIRMQQVLSNKEYQDSQSVYVQMRTLEYDFDTRKEKNEDTPLFNYENEKYGEIDEFLTEQNKSSLLIHGIAGSGKSLTARKIEEYLWIMYKIQYQNKLWSEIKGNIPLIPIFIQLPTLKEPKFNALEETLLSSIYRFDQKQVDLLRESAQNNDISFIFIMDSYDELPQQYQGVNLLISNKIHLWKPQKQKQIPKVITTSRTEAFTKPDYRSWFWENEIIGFQSLKELRLLPFDEAQRQEFIKQFSLLKLKIQIQEQLSVIDKKSDKNQILQDTNEIWTQFLPTNKINKQSQNKQFLLEQTNIQALIKIIKAHPNVTIFNQEQETIFSKLVSNLWHQNTYIESIIQMNLQQLLETPFIINIVVETLPQMNNQVSKPNNIKNHFLYNYVNYQIDYQDRTRKLKELNHSFATQFDDFKTNQQVQKEGLILWESLIENQFFNNWNIQATLEHTRSQIKKIEALCQKDEEQLIIIYKSLTSNKLTLYDFFEQFIESYIENQRQKLIYSNDIMDQNQFQQDIYKYALKLAVQMFNRSETIVERKPQGLLFRQATADPYQEFFEDNDQFKNYRIQVRKCIPIRQRGNYIQFIHKSIQEFLFAKDILDLFVTASNVTDILKDLISKHRQSNKQLVLQDIQQQQAQEKNNLSVDDQRKQQILVQVLEQTQKSILNNINLQDTFNLGALKFLQVKFAKENELVELLYAFVLLSSINLEYKRFSSNCLIILLQVQPFQYKQDFSRMIISDISLDGAIFQHCNLSYSKFDQVSIMGINLNFSNISNCDWSNVHSNDLPTIQNFWEKGSYSILSPDGQIILSIQKNRSNQISIWDAQSGQSKGKLEGHKTYLTNIIISNNGEFALSCDQHKCFRLWNLKSFTQIHEHHIQELPEKMIFSDNDEQIAFITNINEISIINNLNEMDKAIIINLKSKCIALRIFQQQMITLIFDQEVLQFQKWDIINGHINQEITCKPPFQNAPRFGKFQKHLLFLAYSDKTIGKWDTNQYIPIGTPFKGHTQQILCFDFSKDLKYLVSAGRDNLLIIYDVQSSNQIKTLIGHSCEITNVQFSPDAKWITSCQIEFEIKFWDATPNKQLDKQTVITKAEFTPDGKQLIYANNNKQLCFCNADTGQEVIEKINDQIVCMNVHPYGNHLLYSTGFQTKIIDIRLSKQVGQTFQTLQQVSNLGYSSDGNKIFLQIQFEIHIYDTNWQNLIIIKFNPDEQTSEDHFRSKQYPITLLSQNHEYIIFQSSWEKEIILINFQTYEQLKFKPQRGVISYDLATDNKMFIAVDNYSLINIWNIQQSQEKCRYLSVFPIKNKINFVKISLDCRYICGGTVDGYIQVIDPQSGTIQNLVLVQLSSIHQIIFSPCQNYLIALSSDLILNVIQVERKQRWFLFSKYIIPQILSQQSALYGLEFKQSNIISHLGYDITKTFAEKIKNIKKQS